MSDIVQETAPRQDLNSRSSGIDTHTDINYREAAAIIVRSATYIRFFTWRYIAKFLLKFGSYALPMALIPWPVKILTDHVILGNPIQEATDYPAYMWPLINALHGSTSLELLMWLALIGVTLVLTIGSYSTDYEDEAEARLAEGQDYATQVENLIHGGDSKAGGLYGYLEFKLSTRLVQALSHTLRAEIFSRIGSLSMTQLEDQRIGDSIYRVMYDAPQMNQIFFDITHTPFISILLYIQATLTVMSAYPDTPEILWMTAAIFPIWAATTSLFSRAMRRRGQAARAAGAITTSTIEEGMDNILAVQSLGGNQAEQNRFDSDSDESFRRFRSVRLLWIAIGRLGQILAKLVEVLFIIFVVSRVIDGEMSPGDLAVLLLYLAYLRGPAMSLGYLWLTLQDNVAGMRRVFAMLDLPAEGDLGSTDLSLVQDGIALRGAGFTYPDGRRALDNINLDAKIGEIIAFVGPTGAGKTSLAYLIPRFHVATEGDVLIDGHNVNDLTLESMRSQITYVFQETQLFSDSIHNNICYGKPEAGRDEVEEVAKISGIHDFITTLPDGYDTRLGSAAGSKLSVGQKQRISIARGLLRDSKILILDEPTSALDPETEEYLVKSLHEAAKNRLVIIIAHRLSTIAQADKIVFLDNGRIIEQGSHEDLMNSTDGHYRSFVELQTKPLE
ncbi:MAG TPA: ABC transporter ATP-binding protein [Pseudomonadales bacterium]|jgi:ABC-type multidrug transport system fused ATPase/permease subunit|nr:ABC transporter ATP-binding protein [Pseudomonadales bacterium]MDP7451236.1 ABC transporter ATP-binding protein [Arenicellales bacterium]MDP6314988.1 ABC transporter ATP-binding protein [Pseudomonadales bacterium]MDP7314866.1 ABC transporter ATP-binding protein [Pseudomonadales bacterium]MDP7577036.1 ABC transporter ATP-binding protein [Pseudomonadales bacterium]|tara:strand:- start:22190 stop:24205 length:2016 start_codon:yes stop_codon:yes gene_type:complete